jgi:hypothetical protein
MENFDGDSITVKRDELSVSGAIIVSGRLHGSKI